MAGTVLGLEDMAGNKKDKLSFERETLKIDNEVDS